MSWQACAWAVRQKVTGTPAEQLVLLLLANYAGEDGENAFPSVDRLVSESRLTRRAVQKILRRLEEAGLIRQGNQKIAEAKIARADKRPVVYDLNLALEAIPQTDEFSTVSTGDGANPVRPVGERGEPEDATGRTGRHERGELSSPDPSIEIPIEPSTRARAREGALESGAPFAPSALERCGKTEPNAADEPAEAPQGQGTGPDPSPARKPITDAERRRMHHRNFIIDWLDGARPFPALFVALGLDGERADDAAIERLALGFPRSYLRDVAGLVDWAEACLAGDPTAKIPIPAVRRLMARLADPVARALMARRLALLREAAAKADGDDPPAEDQASGIEAA